MYNGNIVLFIKSLYDEKYKQLFHYLENLVGLTRVVLD